MSSEKYRWTPGQLQLDQGALLEEILRVSEGLPSLIFTWQKNFQDLNPNGRQLHPSQ